MAHSGSKLTLEPFLAKLLAQFHTRHWISSDPIRHVHEYRDADDQEVVAMLAACFAYGKVMLVQRAIAAILEPMGAHPAAFVRAFDGRNAWPGFYHRFHDEGHLVVLVRLLQRALKEYGSLGELFRRQAVEGDGLYGERVLNGAARWFQSAALEELAASRRMDLARGMRFLFNAPEDGSACKRMTMLMRWMVRKDEVDLGLWSWIKPSELVIPADTHVARIAYYLRLRKGTELKAANWKMALEITESLREVNPNDPTSYDFALARLGILDICKRKYTRSVCERCPVEPGCRFSQLAAEKK